MRGPARGGYTVTATVTDRPEHMIVGNAATERAQLVATLRDLTDEQWSAETLCTGWDAGDLAAHLIVREREPLAAPGILVGGPFERLTAQRQRARKAAGREQLIAQLASGPPTLLTLGPLDDRQAVEDWIHHEDVRRGGAGLPPRSATARMAGPLWQAVRSFARITLGGSRVAGVVALTDGQTTSAWSLSPSSRFARTSDAAPDVVVEGGLGELVLFVTGRPADVTMTGDDALTTELHRLRRGV